MPIYIFYNTLFNFFFIPSNEDKAIISAHDTRGVKNISSEQILIIHAIFFFYVVFMQTL